MFGGDADSDATVDTDGWQRENLEDAYAHVDQLLGAGYYGDGDDDDGQGFEQGSTSAAGGRGGRPGPDVDKDEFIAAATDPDPDVSAGLSLSETFKLSIDQVGYTTPDGRYDWTAFGMSTSGDPWVDEQDMRLHLSAIGLTLSAGVQVIP